MPVISIVVPIYNTGKYLYACLESIINQTFTDIEIILINDGSTDNCQLVINEFLKKDSRIISVEQENQGQSIARNNGILIAKGKYLGFVDADDVLDINMMKKMYELAEKENLDLVVCGVEVIFNSTNSSKYINNCNKSHIVLNGKEFDSFIKKYYLDSGYLASACNKLYKREIIINSNILFEDYRTLQKEDELFNLYFLSFTKSVGFINEPLYKYFRRDGSSSTTVKKDSLNRYIKYLNTLERFILTNGFSFMTNLLYYKYLSTINEIFSVYNYKEKITLNDIHLVIHSYIKITGLIEKSNRVKINDLMSVMRMNKKNVIFIVYYFLLKIKLEKGISVLQYLKIKLIKNNFS